MLISSRSAHPVAGPVLVESEQLGIRSASGGAMRNETASRFNGGTGPQQILLPLMRILLATECGLVQLQLGALGIIIFPPPRVSFDLHLRIDELLRPAAAVGHPPTILLKSSQDCMLNRACCGKGFPDAQHRMSTLSSWLR